VIHKALSTPAAVLKVFFFSFFTLISPELFNTSGLYQFCFHDGVIVMTEFHKGINLLDKYYQLLLEKSKQPYAWNSHIVHMCFVLSHFRCVNTAFFLGH
jgi:hypothetical protein